MILTNKPTLVKSSKPAVTSYEQVSVNDILEGIIVNIRDNGVLVVFYNDVKVSVCFYEHLNILDYT